MAATIRKFPGAILALAIIFMLSTYAGAFDNPWDTHHSSASIKNPPPPPRKPEPEPKKKKDADPVLMDTGAFVYPIVDFRIPGKGPAMKIARVYESGRFSNEGPFGFGWRFNFDLRAYKVREPGMSGITGKLVYTPEGDSILFDYLGYGYQAPSASRYSMPDDNTLIRNDGTVFTLQKIGQNWERATSIVDRCGNALTLDYDSFGKLTRITDRFDRAFDIQYGGNNLISRITGPDGSAFIYEYDYKNYLIAVTNPCGHTTRYTYDSAGRLASIADHAGVTWLSNTYEESNRVARQSHNGGIFQFSYPSLLSTEVTHPNGGVWTYFFDDRGRPERTINPLGQITRQEWGPNSQQTSFTNEKNETTTYHYEGMNLTQQIDPMGGVWESTFNGHDIITSYKTPAGALTQYEYDEQDRIIKVTDPLGSEVAFTYLPDGLVSTITRSGGRVSTITYDSRGYPQKVEDDAGRIHQFTFDIMGRMTSRTNPLGHTTRFEYDPVGRTTAIVDPMNRRTEMTYDHNGNRKTLKNNLGETWLYEYDPYDRLQKIINPLGGYVSFTYNSSGDLTRIDDSENRVMLYEYDLMRRLTAVTNPRNGRVQYQYNACGSLEKITDAKNRVVTYTYDALERVVSVKFPDNRTEICEYGWTHHPIARTMRDGSRVTYERDVLNRVVKQVMPDGEELEYTWSCCGLLPSRAERTGSVLTFTHNPDFQVEETSQDGRIVRYEYNALGRRTKMTWPDNFFVTYEYNAAGQMTRIRDQAGNVVIEYEYDGAGRRSRSTAGNSTRTDYQYDTLGRTTAVINRGVGGTGMLWSFNYTYDSVGNRLSMTTNDGAHAYTYDGSAQILSVDYPETLPFPDQTVQYDAMGNRTSFSAGGTPESYISDTMNRYTKVGAANFTHDARGNMTSNGSGTFQYGSDNRMTAATITAKVYSSLYDPIQRRRETNFDGTATQYLYDGMHVIAEYDGGGALLARYIIGADTDEVVKMIRGGQEYYYHYDTLGSVAGITNASGTIVESYHYDAFGKPETASSAGNPYLFTGRRYEPGTGLYYYRARHYSPGLGRFLQEDPVMQSMRLKPGREATLNLYHYARNNPVYYRDPTGYLIIVDPLPGEDYSEYITHEGINFDTVETPDGPAYIRKVPGKKDEGDGPQDEDKEEPKNCKKNCMDKCVGEQSARANKLWDDADWVFNASACIEGASDFAAGGWGAAAGGCAAGMFIPGMSDAGKSAAQGVGDLLINRNCDMSCMMECIN